MAEEPVQRGDAMMFQVVIAKGADATAGYTARLDDTSRLFLFTVRGIAGDAAMAHVAQQGLMFWVGLVGFEETYAGFERMVRCVSAHGRRRLRLSRPQADTATPDELALVNLVAAMQRREWALARGLVAWIVPKPFQNTLLVRASALAGALTRQGIGLGGASAPAGGRDGDPTAGGRAPGP